MPSFKFERNIDHSHGRSLRAICSRCWRAAVALALGISATPCWPGGTMGTSELQGLLDQQPAARDALLATVRLSDSAFGEVRFGSHFVHLGGMRAGPYTIPACSKARNESLRSFCARRFAFSTVTAPSCRRRRWKMRNASMSGSGMLCSGR